MALWLDPLDSPNVLSRGGRARLHEASSRGNGRHDPSRHEMRRVKCVARGGARRSAKNVAQGGAWRRAESVSRGAARRRAECAARDGAWRRAKCVAMVIEELGEPVASRLLDVSFRLLWTNSFANA